MLDILMLYSILESYTTTAAAPEALTTTQVQTTTEVSINSQSGSLTTVTEVATLTGMRLSSTTAILIPSIPTNLRIPM